MYKGIFENFTGRKRRPKVVKNNFQKYIRILHYSMSKYEQKINHNPA